MSGRRTGPSSCSKPLAGDAAEKSGVRIHICPFSGFLFFHGPALSWCGRRLENSPAIASSPANMQASISPPPHHPAIVRIGKLVAVMSGASIQVHDSHPIHENIYWSHHLLNPSFLSVHPGENVGPNGQILSPFIPAEKKERMRERGRIEYIPFGIF